MSIETRGYVIFIKVETKRPYSPRLHLQIEKQLGFPVLQIENQLGFPKLQISCYN